MLLLWRTWTHRANVLVRQAANMGWVAVGVITTDGYRNTKLSRGGLLSVVWYLDGNIELLAPPVPRRFKDFVELESGLASLDSPETRYFLEVENYIREMGYYEELVLPARAVPEFRTALARVYLVGFEADTPAKVVGDLVADGASKYSSNPEMGLLFLDDVAKNLYKKHH
jgi:hypothetical protein